VIELPLNEAAVVVTDRPEVQELACVFVRTVQWFATEEN